MTKEIIFVCFVCRLSQALLIAPWVICIRKARWNMDGTGLSNV